MNQLQIFILVLMVLFTIFHFWSDLKNFWNTGNKFGEGFAGRLVPGDTSIKFEGKPNESINPEECQAVANFDTYHGYPFSKINEVGNPKGCFIQDGTSPGVKGVYYNENPSSTADCGAHNVSICVEKAQAGVMGTKIQLAIDGAWNTGINKEFECKPGIHPVDESAAYSDSCEPRDKCNVQINEKCEARIGMWDRCTNKNTDDGGKPTAKQDSETRSLGWSNYITAGQSAAGAKNSCKIKQLIYKYPETPQAQEMTAQAPTNETPVVNNIATPKPPEWHDSKLAKEYKLPNGFLVRPGDGKCPNGCKIPQYDDASCANEIFEGKEYRNCKWVKDGTNDIDCKNCGAVLLPKNEYGYARTNPALFDIKNVGDAIQFSQVDSKDNYYNMGKNFMKQLAYMRHFSVPDIITSKEYVTIGKLVYAHQSNPQNEKVEQTLTRFINTILRTNSLSENGKRINANDLITEEVSAEGGNFDVDKKKLSGEGIIAYKQGLEEAEDDNRLGGSKTLYRKMTRQDTGYTKFYHPRDPRRRPSPYNSIWNVFSY